MKLVHGGDWAGYQNEYGKQPLDFSASISPLGLPDGVFEAAKAALCEAERYPDPLCRALRSALADYHGFPEEKIVCGNGATDLIYRICRILRPKRAAVLTPGFAEYALALQENDCVIDEIPLLAEEGFQITENTVHAIPYGCELLFLCNPNNPTGTTAERSILRQLLSRCRETGMILVADESFLDFTEDPEALSLIPELEHCPQMMVLRAFTKTWAMAGLRLGYVLCGSTVFAERLQLLGQPWTVSNVAQAAGVAALQEKTYVQKLRQLISAQRRRMIRELEQLGLHVVPGEANFLLFQSENHDLGEALRERGILIRDCSNFAGLTGGWFRCAIRKPEENDRLLDMLREVITVG